MRGVSDDTERRRTTVIAPTIRFTGGHRDPPVFFLCEKWEDGHCATFLCVIMSIVKYCLLMSAVSYVFSFQTRRRAQCADK